jgi:hypothetical protein
MVFVKIDANFLDIDELSITSSVPVEDIENCLNKGLLNDQETVKRYFPQIAPTVKKLKLAAGLSSIRMEMNDKRDLVDKLGDGPKDGIHDAIKSFGLDEIQARSIIDYLSRL